MCLLDETACVWCPFSAGTWWHLAQVSSFATFLGQVGAGAAGLGYDSRMERKYPWDHSHAWCKKVRAGELRACCLTKPAHPRPAWWQPGPTGRPFAHLGGRPGSDRRIGLMVCLPGPWVKAATTLVGQDERAKGMP